jgi:hypothetical protein
MGTIPPRGGFFQHRYLVRPVRLLIILQADSLSFLFRFDDRPMLYALGYYRNEEEDFFNHL